MTEVDKTRQLRQKNPEVLLGGEREGYLIPGFDLDNSPASYTPERVAGRRIVMTTTNGAQAVARVGEARRVLLGALVNADAVAQALLPEEQVMLCCAGTKGQPSLEDVLTAGAILWRLEQRGARMQLDDAGYMALLLYSSARGKLDKAASLGNHYRLLAERGGTFTEDLAYCFAEDITQMVPVLRGGWFVPLARTVEQA